ncbi:MAG: preprotein translocase subunit SecE [Peptococcaceae bacterium MAG4]|nr:preprotein translocase subunit SecE [Peptococcaceae bacterium MAG4]
MAVAKKQDNNNSKKEADKKGPGKKQLLKRGPDKEPSKKDLALTKDRKDTAKKDSGKKDLPVKKEKVNRIEQAQKFLRGALNELKKVHWPTRREIIIYTVVVLVAVVVVGALIWLFDSLLSTLLKLIL